MSAARFPVYDHAAFVAQRKAEGMVFIQRGYDALVVRAKLCLPALSLSDLDKVEAALVRGIDAREDLIEILRDLALRGVIPSKHITKPLPSIGAQS